MQTWRRFQIEIRPEAFEELASEAARNRRSVREQAGWTLEQALLGSRRTPSALPTMESGEAVRAGASA